MKRHAHILWLLPAVIPFIAHAQGTAFTYQGRLQDGTNPANGSYDLTFSLFDSQSGGNAVSSDGITNYSVTISEGIFSAALDFGYVFTGAERWLEMGVRTNGESAFTILSPRQRVSATPYAITAGNLTGVLPASQLSGTVAATQLPATVVTNNQAGINLTGSFNGSGAGLTNTTYSNMANWIPNDHWDWSLNLSQFPNSTNAIAVLASYFRPSGYINESWTNEVSITNGYLRASTNMAANMYLNKALTQPVQEMSLKLRWLTNDFQIANPANMQAAYLLVGEKPIQTPVAVSGYFLHCKFDNLIFAATLYTNGLSGEVASAGYSIPYLHRPEHGDEMWCGLQMLNNNTLRISYGAHSVLMVTDYLTNLFYPFTGKGTNVTWEITYHSSGSVMFRPEFQQFAYSLSRRDSLQSGMTTNLFVATNSLGNGVTLQFNNGILTGAQ